MLASSTPDDSSQYCQATYSSQSAQCLDLSGALLDSDGGSVFCNLDGNVEDGGCEHQIHCCMCSQVRSISCVSLVLSAKIDLCLDSVIGILVSIVTIVFSHSHAIIYYTL